MSAKREEDQTKRTGIVKALKGRNDLRQSVGIPDVAGADDDAPGRQRLWQRRQKPRPLDLPPAPLILKDAHSETRKPPGGTFRRGIH